MKKSKPNHEEQLARALADYDNLVKRITRDRKEIITRAEQNLVEDLLPAIDSLERASEHLNDKGLEMAMESLKQTLAQHGVEEIKVAKGEKFDSRIHEAVESVPGGKHGEIAEVSTKGYAMAGSVIRPAKVIVFKGQLKEK
ncbi:nucleotide exchange factor GrpE [Candidatus Woesebacteria bacterium]|nr:nucleotide exchange factor GrpE [Candidatus Woesebacteria bacterium]|tara:strand:- start:466 stop:888 length:423 start_codon:yes stop_codon:yes gene_type:complete